MYTQLHVYKIPCKVMYNPVLNPVWSRSPKFKHPHNQSWRPSYSLTVKTLPLWIIKKITIKILILHWCNLCSAQPMWAPAREEPEGSREIQEDDIHTTLWSGNRRMGICAVLGAGWSVLVCQQGWRAPQGVPNTWCVPHLQLPTSSTQDA
jgi:hypothetical protein